MLSILGRGFQWIPTNPCVCHGFHAYLMVQNLIAAPAAVALGQLKCTDFILFSGVWNVMSSPFCIGASPKADLFNATSTSLGPSFSIQMLAIGAVNGKLRFCWKVTVDREESVMPSRPKMSPEVILSLFANESMAVLMPFISSISTSRRWTI